MSLWFYLLLLHVISTSETKFRVSNAGSAETNEMSAQETLRVIQKEVDSLEKKIAYQEEEIKVLEKWVSYLKMAGSKLRLLDEMETGVSLHEISSKNHSEMFTHFTAVSIKVPPEERNNVPKSKLLSFQSMARRNIVHVVVTVNTDQQIKLWDSNQNELAMVETGSKSQVSALLVTAANVRNFLLAGFVDGHVLIYAFSAWRKYDWDTETMWLEGSINVFSNGMLKSWTQKDGKEKQNTLAERAKEGDESLDLKEKVPAVSTLGINSRKHARQFLVGYDNGYIRAYRRDSRLVKEMFSGNSSILEIGWKTDRTSIPIFTQSGFRFCKLSGFRMIGGFCPHKEGTQFTGYAFDAIQSNILYVAYSDGRLMLFDSRKLAHRWLCTPKVEIEVESGSPLHLEAMEGYLLASSPTSLYIFNTSDLTMANPHHPYLVEKRSIRKDYSASSRGCVAATLDSYHHTLIVTADLYSAKSCDPSKEDAGSVTGSSMIVYESDMKPKEKQKNAKGWSAMLTRTPMLIVGLIVVGFMQFSGKSKNPLSKILAGSRTGLGRGWRGKRRCNYQLPPRLNHEYQ